MSFKLLAIIIAIILVMGTISFFCIKSKRNNLDTIMLDMISHKVKCELDSMYHYKKNIIEDTIKCVPTPKYRYILYYDSLSCTKCSMNNMVGINTILNKLESTNCNVDFIFIFDPIDNDTASFRQNYDLSSLTTPVYLDVNHVFRKNNTFLPKEKIFHSFLINNEDSIVLIGDPINNEQIETLFFDIINKE